MAQCLVILGLCVGFLAACAPMGLNPLERNSNRGGSYGERGASGHGSFAIRKRLALLPFFNDAPRRGYDLSHRITEELRSELSLSESLIVDSQATGDFFVTSRQIYAGGGTELTELASRARRFGIGLILYGRIVNFDVREDLDDIGFFRKSRSFAGVDIEIRLFSVRSNREILSRIFEGQVSNDTFRIFSGKKGEKLRYQEQLLYRAVKVALRRSIPLIVKAADKMEWTGRIAKVMGPKIYINAGKESGVKLGDVMKVITEGSEIYDPETGALIGTSKGEVKATLEVVDYFGADGAISVLHSGGSVLEGDFVQLYE